MTSYDAERGQEERRERWTDYRRGWQKNWDINVSEVQQITKMTHKGIDLVRCANALQFLSHPLHFSLCDSLRGEGCSHIRKHS